MSTQSKDNGVQLESFCFSTEPAPPKETYVPTDTPEVDTYADTWVGYDKFGRRLADYEEVGPVKKDKYIGMFYFINHAHWAPLKEPFNNTEFLNEHPEAYQDFDNPLWKTPGDTQYFAAEPIYGYYAGTLDEWVTRKQIELLSAGGVDVLFFDNSNGSILWRNAIDYLCKTLEAAKADGQKVPKIALLTPFGASVDTFYMMKHIYLTMYKEGKYSDLWFYYDGKPFILAYPDALRNCVPDNAEDKALAEEMLAFFSFREPWPLYAVAPPSEKNWGWAQSTPQSPFGKTPEGGVEQVPVTTSLNLSSDTNETTAMSQPYSMGRNYTTVYGHDLKEGAYEKNEFFREQLEYALALDPKMLFVTGWNEWVAGRYREFFGIPNAFVDAFNAVKSRDIEPAKGPLADSTYMMFVDAARKLKGVRPAPVATGARTITLGQDNWDGVGPVYKNEKGIMNRDIDGYKGTHYTDNSARNNIIEAKVSYDDNNLYFIAATADEIKQGERFMELLLNTDRNFATGWWGYDYKVSDGTILKFDGSDFTKAGKAQMFVGNNYVEISIPKSILPKGAPDFEFKWVDNIDLSDIMNCYTQGETAPTGRFNYLYTTVEQKLLPNEAQKELAGGFVVREGSNLAYMGGRKIRVCDVDSRVTPFTQNGNTYVPNECLHSMLKAKVDVIGTTVNLYTADKTVLIGPDEIRVDKLLYQYDYPTVEKDGRMFVSLEFLAQVFQKELVYADGAVSIGRGVSETALESYADIMWN